MKPSFGPTQRRSLSLVTYCRALRGDVVTELPPFLAAAPIREKRLVPLLPQFPLPEWSINLLYPPHRHQSAIVRTYLDFCQSYLPQVVQACEPPLL